MTTLLITVRNEVRANAQSVNCVLGGGANGHLGLILDPRQYATISQYPYVRPMFPGPLYVPPNIPQQMAIMLQNQHKEHGRMAHIPKTIGFWTSDGACVEDV